MSSELALHAEGIKKTKKKTTAVEVAGKIIYFQAEGPTFTRYEYRLD